MERIKIILAILPIFILALYVYVHDKEKEPTRLLLLSFIFGILISIPTLYVEMVITKNLDFLQHSYITSFIYVFIGIALIEEGYKFLVTYTVLYPNKNVNYTFDMIVYCTFVGLGFAFFENLLYLNTISISSLILRGFTAVPIHLSCGIIMGYYLSIVKSEKKDKKKNFIKSIIYPTLIHTIYNYYLVYISNLIKKLFSFNTATIITYSLLVLLLGSLFLYVHYILYKSSEEDKKIKGL